MQKKQNQQKDKRSSRRAITPAEAMAALERAFRSGDPDEIERQLREMLQVQVAVVESVDDAKCLLVQRKRLLTVSVPYGVFIRKVSTLDVYQIDWDAVMDGDFEKAIRKVELKDILPNQTYLLLKDQAGYFPEKGLTFTGSGEITGTEDLSRAERQEKFTEGKFQTWQEHARGVWEKVQQLISYYRPFIKTWAKKVFKELGKEDIEQEEEFLKPLLWALQIAVLFHDVGKLNKAWQDAVWKNEQMVSGRPREGFIARASAVPEEKRGALQKAPAHAPFAYPFIRTLLRELLGDYRFLDAIALASARHHSLELSGSVKRGLFQLPSPNLVSELTNFTLCLIGVLSDEEKNRLKDALQKATEAIQQGSEMDEPPSPSDDFYFLYCLANRLVKMCDWEDAGDNVIELRDMRC